MEQDVDRASAGHSRPDVAERLQRNKSLDFFVTKKTMHQFCRKEARVLAWDEVLLDVNQAVAEAYLLASFYALRQLESGKTLGVMAKEFFQTCLSLVTNRARTKLSLQQRFQLEQARAGTRQAPRFTEAAFQAWLSTKTFYGQPPNKFNAELELAGFDFMQLRGATAPIDATHLNTGWLSTAARAMATNTQNSVVANFAKRLRRHALETLGLEKEEAHALVDAVFAADYTGNDPIVQSLRAKTPRAPSGKISWKPHDLVPLMHEFLKEIETTNIQNADNDEVDELRVYGLLPSKKGFEASYFTMDSCAFRGLLKRSLHVDLTMTVELGNETWTLGECLHWKNESRWKELSDLWWRRFFRIDAVEKEEKRAFAREISTDGYGVSIHMSRPTRGKKKRAKKRRSSGDVAADVTTSDVLGPRLSKTPKGKITDYDVVWGIDPGRTDFITATNNLGKSVRFRTTAYRSASGFMRSNRRSRNEIAKDTEVRDLLRATPTKKTASLSVFMKHINFSFEHGRKILIFFYSRIFRKLKFHRYTQKTRQIDRAINEMAPKNKKTIIGFGDSGAACNSHIKNCPAGPVKMLARRLASRCEVVVVDEFRTSCMHFDCACAAKMTNQTTKRVFRNEQEKVVKVHKVLHCLTKNGGCGLTVDRDVNASKNILSIIMRQLQGDPTRPERLRRQSRSTPPRQTHQ